ncbi:MAG: type II secretion system F family protein [Bythopirellula sp.]|nr:type II secretion system F family protein [Bythopirellula sp.]
MNTYNTLNAKFAARPLSASLPQRSAPDMPKRSAPEMLELTDWMSTTSTSNVRKRGSARGVRLQDIAEFTSQLSIMVRSGIDVATALGSLSAQCQRPALAEVLTSVYQSVMAGTTLSESLRRHENVFDAAFVATVAAGEASGSLAEVLIQLAQMQRSELRNGRTMRTLLTYPILLLVVSSSVVIGLVVFVLPRFAKIFDQYDMSLPIVTQMLLALAAELRGHWWFWGPVVGVAVIGGLIWRKTATGRLMLDSLWVNAVVIKDVTRAKLTGRICRLLGMMLSNGVPILEGVKLTRNAVKNSLYRALLSKLEEAVVNGQNLASVLQTADIIPRSARDMLITAEATGNITEVSQLLGEYYEEEAEARMRQIVGLIEPALTVGMGAVIAVVVLAVMLPVFDLSTLAQKGH